MLITSGWQTMGAVTESGSIIIHGTRNVAGPVCLGNTTTPKEWSKPLIIDNVLGYKIAKLYAGPFHYCAITEGGLLITWGINVNLMNNDKRKSYQLGNDCDVISFPTIIDKRNFDGNAVLSVACGISHTVVLTATGVYTFGSNSHDQLGRDAGFLSGYLNIVEMIPSFCFKIDNIAPSISQVACGGNFSVALSSIGYVWTWGDNTLGQCGHPDDTLIPTPRLVETPSDLFIVSVSCGVSHTLFLTNTGKIYSCGSNLFGQLGVSDPSLQFSSKLHIVNKLPKDDNWECFEISCCAHASSSISIDGIIYQWGMLRSSDKLKNQYSPQIVDSCYQQHMFASSVSEGISNTIFTTDIALTKAIIQFSQSCRYEHRPNANELIDIINNVPDFMIGPIQTRAVRWLNEMYNLRPYLIIPFAMIPVEIIDKRNLAATLITSLRKGKHHLTSEPSSVSQDLFSSHFEFEVINPHTKSVDAAITLFHTTESIDNVKLTFEPNLFSLSRYQKRKISISIQYDPKDPPPNQTIILAVGANRPKSKKDSVFEFNPSHTSRHFIFLKLTSVASNTRNTRQGFSKKPKQSSRKKFKHLTPYLPHILISHFYEKPKPPTKPFVESFDAAILFVDISGFTSLNEKLAELGPAGPERVSHHINSYFTSLIKAVNQHGGDTLKFAGDALICMFGSPTTDESLEILTRRATQCALTIQTRLAKYDSNQGFTLTLHVGIGAGKIYSLYVGGVDSSWEFLVTGEPLAQLRTCVDLSSTGEVVVSSKVWNLISSYFEGNCIEDSENKDWLVTKVIQSKIIDVSPLPQLQPKSENFEIAARCFIPKAVQVQIDSNQTKWMDELRIVTVLFVKLNSPIPSSSMDEFCNSLHQYLVLMQTEIFRFDGMVRQFLADDKGTVCIAAFGLPPSSHMDGALRGIRAAIAIHKNLKNVNMDNSIGVTTGSVFCGAVGAKNRREYAMVGDIVNLSARLMVAAGKMDSNIKILCDKQTAEPCKGKQELKQLESIYVKGKKNPIDVFCPLEIDNKTQTRRVMLQRRQNSTELSENIKKTCVGRDNETKIILKQLDAVASNQLPCLMVILEGETGTGKSSMGTLAQLH